ncbi:MAG: purine-nucleoside phosphorylase [Turicibacter sp.]|nr:purine-nucleoside phosphorylase [Turicibacter sp.]
MINRINESTEYIKNELKGIKPDVGMILGSGLGDYADNLEEAITIPYRNIPGFLVSTVDGHKGQFVVGKRAGKTIIAMQGRFHFYEGYTQLEVSMPVRVMKNLGVKTIIVTNAAGGVNTSFAEGALMLITDHINYSGGNPLIGPNLDDFGLRFPDMTQIYTPHLRKKLIDVAKSENIDLVEGVYMMFTGPSYETPAEIRMARIVGADAVGMSTVPETIVAAHTGIQILGISCITNMAAGVLDAPLNHLEVMETANRVKSTFVKVLDLALTIVD